MCIFSKEGIGLFDVGPGHTFLPEAVIGKAYLHAPATETILDLFLPAPNSRSIRVHIIQGPHCIRENTGNLEILYAQFGNSLILKIKDIVIIATKFSFFLETECLPSQLCIGNSHKSLNLAQGKSAVRQGKHTEFENRIWVGTLIISSKISHLCWFDGRGVSDNLLHIGTSERVALAKI